jgi:NADH-quinone oxidoreductase subunit G
MCNVGRDLGTFFERPRAERAMVNGQPVDLAVAIEQARLLIEQARRPVALVSNWASNEELEAFERALGARFEAFYKIYRVRQPEEPPEDDFLVRADKNPNTAAVHAKFAAYEGNAPLDAADLLLVWGEGFDFTRVPEQAQTIVLGAWKGPADALADVFIPISIQTERSGHYTNFEGVVSGFEPCFAKKVTVAHAEALFAALAVVPVNA